MPATVDLSSEAALSDLFDDDFVRELTRYLGLDPDTQPEDMPLDITELLTDAVAVCEQEQWRFIRRKSVSLLLPFSAFLECDKLVFLPFGPISSLSTFSYTDEDGATQTISSSDYTIYAGEPARLWCNDWNALFTNIDTKQPYPITVAYTTGYSTYAAVPRATVRALKVLCYHMFEQRDSVSDSVQTPVPQSYEAHRDLNMLNNRRALKYISDDFSQVSHR
jgi:uncharacterized phiE125 gp8 family phage protein